MMDVILIRHGETEGNKRGAYIGAKTDEALSSEGAKKLCKIKSYYSRLLGKYDKKIFLASPMLRCIQTLEVLFGDVKYAKVEDFIEMDFGIFEGKSFADLKDDTAYRKWVDSYCEDLVPEGEKKSDFALRCVKAFDQLVREQIKENTCEVDEAKIKEASKVLVIICHGGTIMSIMENITGEDFYKFSVKNGEGYLLHIEEDADGYNKISYDRLNTGLYS